MTTRLELLQDVDEWLARDDINNGPGSSIIRVMEAEINRRVRCRANERTTQLTITARETALDDRYVSLRHYSLDSALDRKIDYLTPERLRTSPIWNNQGGARLDNSAIAFTIEGSDSGVFNVVMAPEPAAANPITINLTWFRKFPLLVNNTDTNWLLQNHYDIYLWAALKTAAIFLDEDALEMKYERLLEKALEQLRKEEQLARTPGATGLRPTGNPRRVV